jgi:integrase
MRKKHQKTRNPEPEKAGITPYFATHSRISLAPGLRQGEVTALRWKDADWKAGLIRVCRNYTRGRFGTPMGRGFRTT